MSSILGPAQIDTGTTNFMVGAATPQMETPSVDSSGVADFFGGLMPSVQSAFNTFSASAAIKGAADAVATDNALEQVDTKVKEQNFLFRSAYKQGYVGAAMNGAMADYKQHIATESAAAAQAGMTLEDYDKRAKAKTAEFASKTSGYLNGLPKEQALSVLQEIQATTYLGREAFKKEAAAVATVRNRNALNSSLKGSIDVFNQQMAVGDAGAAMSILGTAFESINTNELLSPQDKKDIARDFITSLSYTTDRPEVIEGVMELAGKVLPPEVAADILKEGNSQWKRVGEKQEGKTQASLWTQMQEAKYLPPEKQKAAMDGVLTQAALAHEHGILSSGSYMSLLKMTAEPMEKAFLAASVDMAVSDNLSMQAGAGQLGIPEVEYKKMLLARPEFANTAEGNLNLIRKGDKSNDPAMVNIGIDRIGQNTSETLRSLAFVAKEDGQLSQKQEEDINAWVTLWNDTPSQLGRQALLEALPAEYRGMMQAAAMQSPDNLSGTLLNDITRIAEQDASGPMPSTMKLSDVDGSKLNNWLSFGAESDNQVNSGAKAVMDSHQYLVVTNPEIRDPKLLNDMAYADAKRRQIELNVGGNTVHAYIPPKFKIRDMMGDFAGEPQDYVEALNAVLNAQAGLFQNGVSNVTLTWGTGADGKDLVASYEKDGAIQRVDVSNSVVLQKATQTRRERTSAEWAKGVQRQGLTSTAFVVHNGDSKKVQTMNVTGANSLGVAPQTWGELKGSILNAEAVVLTKKGDGRGTGQIIGASRHSNSGRPMPNKVTVEQAIQMLQEDLEQVYVPIASKSAQRSGVDFHGSAVLLLTDLAYHGGNGSSNPMGRAMGEFNRSEKNARDTTKLIEALRNTTAYKQSGDARKKQLGTFLSRWVAQNAPTTIASQNWRN